MYEFEARYLINFYHPCKLDDRLLRCPPVPRLLETWGKLSLILVPEATFCQGRQKSGGEH
jgi:hypothetical protein